MEIKVFMGINFSLLMNEEFDCVCSVLDMYKFMKGCFEMFLCEILWEFGCNERIIFIIINYIGNYECVY